MIFKRIDIDKENNVYLMAYLHENVEQYDYVRMRPSVLVCPGGGYNMCSPREADPVALQYLAKDFNAFVLYYSLGEKAAFPQPVLDVSKALKIIRENADEWHVIKNQIAVLGFSAGGHLAASIGTLWNEPEIMEKSGCMNGENKPNALILVYPVITKYSWMRPAVDRLAGVENPEKWKKLLNANENVGKHTPSAFLVHTFRDNAVSVDESLCFAKALSENDIPFEMHIYPNGGHGMGLGTVDTMGADEPSFSTWCDLSISWLKRLFGNPDEASKPVNRAKQNFN